MEKILSLALLALLAACQSTPDLEDDTRYVKLAKVVDVHEFTEAERKDAKLQMPDDSGVGVSVGIGFSSGGGGFGGLMLGAGSIFGGGYQRREVQPQIAYGANRITVQPLNASERMEVLSYGNYKAGDCVKLFSGHPTEFARLFDLKAGEHCE